MQSEFIFVDQYTSRTLLYFAQVLVVEPNSNRVVLTAKKSLVESGRPILRCLSDARVGLVTDAVVNKISEKGLIVEFYNNLKAFIPRNELMSVDFFITERVLRCSTLQGFR